MKIYRHLWFLDTKKCENYRLFSRFSIVVNVSSAPHLLYYFSLWGKVAHKHIELAYVAIMASYFSNSLNFVFCVLHFYSNVEVEKEQVQSSSNSTMASRSVLQSQCLIYLFNFLVGKNELQKKELWTTKKKKSYVRTQYKNNVICFCLTDPNRCFRPIVCFLTVG